MDRKAPMNRSGNVKSCGYDDGVLEIEFQNGGVYRYYGVPEGIYKGIAAAPSPGGYLQEHVIRAKFKYRKKQPKKEPA